MKMFKRKQDVDKHITSILSRKKDEKERQAQGFQIARLYYDIKEYPTAKRFLSGFLFVRENVPAAHQLMGEINEALGEKEEAIKSYKRALNLGGYGNSNKQLVLKICELYCEQGTDIERMKYWCDQCEKFYPKSDVIFKLKTQIAEASNDQEIDNSNNIEDLIVSELINRPTDLKLRIKLLNMFMESNRHEEAYDTAISTDLTTAFVDRLPWFEFIEKVFRVYGEKFSDSKTDLVYNQHLLHILRNITYLSMGGRDLEESVQSLLRFDQQLKSAASLACQEEEWMAMMREMKGQMFFLAGLVLLKKAQTGIIEWHEVSQLSGACFLASHSINPIDCQAPWFVRAHQGRAKLNNWWYLQSYDRLSQVGHMLLQLSHNNFVDWSRKVKQSIMAAKGHQKIFAALFGLQDIKSVGETSFFYQAIEMVDSSDPMEPITERHMIDIDRVAYQVHLSSLSHLIWLCLQKYTNEMDTQPNYHFNLLDNIQFSTKNIDSGAAESLCQLDILVFLLAAVKCAASAVADKSTSFEDKNERPSLLPVCLSRPLCTQDQEEWWTATYKFCTNSVKEDFSKLRRVLIRGLETVRLIGPHGVSVPMVTHIARSLDARVKSYQQAEHGCRCPARDLVELEFRAAFYWEKAKQALQKLQRNHQTPLPKNRLFKEFGDTDVPPLLLDKYMAEATFALSVAAMKNGQFEIAIQGFEGHRSVWAKFYCAQINKILADKEAENEDQEDDDKRQALIFKARDHLFDVMDMLDGDKAHELNILVSKELEDLESKIHDLELSNVRSSMFYTPAKSPAPLKSVSRINGVGHSTPRNAPMYSFSSTTNGFDDGQNNTEINRSVRDHSPIAESHSRPRPSPERLDLQIKSLSYSQASLFKMVMDRNEELIMINGKMMEELRDNNNQLKNVLTDNKSLMEELKTLLGENRDMMKQIKTELSSLKPALHPAAGATQVSPATPLFVSHMSTPAAPRGPFPAFPTQAPVMPLGYGNFPSAVPTKPSVGNAALYYPSGMKSSNVGKYRQQSDEDEEEEEDLSNIDEASAIYREYLDAEQSYNQYFTPEAQMLDLSHAGAKSGMEGHPSTSMPPFQPRTSIPPGYFAAALRGQTLQYSPAAQTPGQVKPTPGPGFFSTPPTGSIVPAAGVGSTGIKTSAPVRMAIPTTTPLMVVATPPTPADSTQSPTLTALTGQRSITTGFTKPEVAAPASVLAPATSGIQSLFYAKAVLEPKKLKGEITVLVDSGTNVATVLMMGETKDILFNYNIQSLKLEEPSFQPTHVILLGSKLGSADQEKIVVSFENAALVAQLKEAIQKAAASCQPKATSQQVASAVSTKPILFGNISVTSSPATNGTTKPPLFGISASKETSKFSFGGLTFSSTPAVETAAEKERAKIDTHKQTPVVTKSETSKPFAGFSLTTKSDVISSDSAKTVADASIKVESTFATNQKSPGMVAKSLGMAAKSSSGGEEERVEEYEPNVEFKPVISLPDLVEKKTGEENETEIFVEKCRLFRFDPESKQWKERGVGEIKILRSKDQVRFRIVMRREQILKLCANHFLSPEMKLTPMASSDRAWCYFAMDFSEEEIKNEHLAVKFKNAEKAKLFHEKFNECCKQLSASSTTAGEAATSSGAGRIAVDTSKGAQKPSSIFPATSLTNSENKPLSAMFKPKAGSWECSGCLIRNDEAVVKCPACNTLKPGSKPASTQATQSLAEMFKPKAGSWECGSCLIRNSADLVKCLACGTVKPGAKLGDTSKDKLSTGFVFGGTTTSEAGIKFGASSVTSTLPTTGGFVFNSSALTASNAPSGGFTFKSPAVTSTAVTPEFRFGSSTTPASTVTMPTSGFVFKAPAVTGAANTATSLFGVTTTSSGFVSQTTKPSSAIPATTGSSLLTSVFSSKPSFSIGTSTPASASSTTTVSSMTTVTSTVSAGFNFGNIFNVSSNNKAGSSTKPSAASSGLLAKLLTSDDSVTDESAKPKPSTGFNFTMPPKTTATTPAQAFSFTKSPPKSQTVAGVPASPEVDERGLYVNKEGDDSHIHFEPVVSLPAKIEVKTGEENEDIVFESRAKLYRFIGAEWKEKGVGVVKILRHKDTQKTRILMRRDQILKICCNHLIEPGLNLQPMAKSEGKAWIWYAMDYSEEEGKMEQLAIRFRTAETAKEFQKIFDQCRDSVKTSPWKIESSIHKVQGDTPAAKKELFKDTSNAESTNDNEVIFVGEDKPTPDQVARARKYLLPDTFYLYENKPPCPGCIGCEDDGLPATVSVATKSASNTQPTEVATKPASNTQSTKVATKPSSKIQPTEVVGKESTKEIAKAAQSCQVKQQTVQEKSVFGGSTNLPDFASLTSDGPLDKTNEGFVFGSSGSIDFSSLAQSSQVSDFSWKKESSSSTPFKFAGAGQKLFGGSATSGSGDKSVNVDEADGEDSGVVQSNDIHFEPVIPLPDLVKVKTGEEDWTPLFCHRAKLYKFDKQLSQWKERGLGDIKILSHNTKAMFRVLQRREQVLKVSCNHLITADMELKPMATSETSWCWIANDLTEVEPSVEKFAVKFKNKETAVEFQSVFENCQEKLRNSNNSSEEQTQPEQNERTQQQLSAPVQQQQQQAEAAYEDEDEDGEDNEDYKDDDDDEEDEEEDENDVEVLYEKRVTLCVEEDGQWKKLGTGTLQVTYNEDLNGNSINFTADDGEIKCNHVICREHAIILNQRNCSWRPIDYTTDEPVRKHFMATFSSAAAAEEFATIFNEGQRLALDSEISETLPNEMDFPVIFSAG